MCLANLNGAPIPSHAIQLGASYGHVFSREAAYPELRKCKLCWSHFQDLRRHATIAQAEHDAHSRAEEIVGETPGIDHLAAGRLPLSQVPVVCMPRTTPVTGCTASVVL